MISKKKLKQVNFLNLDQPVIIIKILIFHNNNLIAIIFKMKLNKYFNLINKLFNKLIKIM